MFKKIILFTSIIASSSMAFATTPYVGGSFGVGNLGGHYSVLKIGKVFSGFGNTFGESQNIYLGGELNVDAYHYPGVHMIYGTGISFIPGYMLTKNTMAYARLSLEQVRYHDTNVCFRAFGAQLGLGLQTNLSKNWGVRGEFDNGNQLNVGLVYKFN